MWLENDHASIRFSLSGLQQGVHPDSPHRGTRKGWPGVSTLRRQASNSSGSGVLRRYLQEELGCRGCQEALRGEKGCYRGSRKIAVTLPLRFPRLQLDHLTIDAELAVSVVVNGFWMILRRIRPGFECFQDEEVELVDESAIDYLAQANQPRISRYVHDARLSGIECKA
jgi:hypothetical protein